MRIDHHIGGQHARDRARRAHHRDIGGRIEPGLAERRGNSGGNVKDEKAPMAHGVFDIISEHPEVEHVAAEMHQPAMQEHRRHQRQKGEDIGVGGKKPVRRKGEGKHGKLVLALAECDLPDEHQHADRDHCPGDEGRPVRRVVVRNWDHGRSERKAWASVLTMAVPLWRI
jgi:hypothetical protein